MNKAVAAHSSVVGLIGAGIQHSSSPSIHMDEAAALGLHYSYELIDLDQVAGGPAALEGVIRNAEQRGFTGFNVTFPAKQSIIPLLHDLSSEARALHSVNTVLLRDGKRHGHNTDWEGFAESFRRGLPRARLERVAVVGAGGAGAAVAYAALKLGANALRLYDTDTPRAEALAERLAPLFPDRTIGATSTLQSALDEADGVIHATPTGMLKHPGLPIPISFLRPPLWVAEIVYVPLVTELLRVARVSGCQTLDGSGMAVFQAALALELFSGVKPNTGRMLKRFTSKLRTGLDTEAM